MKTQTEKISVLCEIADSFRVQQVAGGFGMNVNAGQLSTFETAVELPAADEPWQIGVIVGPSGSGKTTVVNGSKFAKNVYKPAAKKWPAKASILDGFPEKLSAKEITATLTAVGFSSPPDWLKPYCVLSNGQQFRCDLARALLSGKEQIVFDEFTSVVDRTAAKTGSAAVAKAVRKGRVSCRQFVAVTCHYDVMDWLEPDWILDLAAHDKNNKCQLARGCLQRPPIEIKIHRCSRDTWRLFSHHHYLNHDLHPSPQCYLATWQGQPTCFVAILPQIGKKNFVRISRIVTLPDYQGVGIGSAVLDAVADLKKQAGKRVAISTAHPAMISHLKRSKRWRATAFNRHGNNRNKSIRKHDNETRAEPIVALGRPLASFEFRNQ